MAKNVFTIPLPIPADLERDIRKAGRAVKIKNRTEVMRQALRLGLPVLVQALTQPASDAKAA